MSNTPEEAWDESKYSGYEPDDYSLKALKAAFFEGYQAGLAADRWIDVKERLPEVEGKYLVYDKAFDWFGDINFYIPGGWNWHPLNPRGRVTEIIVTHWQNLPAAPKEKK